jgi:tetratricopeptide (TPR) repeat protein
VGAPLDLRSQAALLVRGIARDRDTATALGLAAWGGLYVLVTAGAFDLARAELDELRVPTTSQESTQLNGVLALCRSLVAATMNRAADADAALDEATELADRTGEGNAYWLGFGPTNVGCWRMHAALETGDHERAIAVAQTLHPAELRVPKYQAYYWANYGRALARARGRRNDAALAFRRAERISPHHFQRDLAARETLTDLAARSKQGDAVDRELRRMAYRAGLPG